MTTRTDDILIEHFLMNYPIEAAHIIENLKTDEIVDLLNTLPGNLAGLVVSHLNIFTSINCLQLLKIESASSIFEKISLDIASMLLRHLPNDFRKLLFKNVSQEISAFLIKVLDYPEGTVGAIVEHYPYTFYEDMTTVVGLHVNA